MVSLPNPTSTVTGDPKAATSAGQVDAQMNVDSVPQSGAEPGPKEDHTPAPAPSTKRLLDIVFLQDATGSQGPYIQACKAAITNICHKISEHMSPSVPPPESKGLKLKLPSNSNDAIRFGLISFRDHPPQDRSYVTKNHGFTSSVDQMKKWLGSLVASGGGDGPEASTAALADALNLEWRQSEEDEEGGGGGTKVVKIVVLVTDAPPHGLGEQGDGFPNGSPDQNDPLDIARQMAEHGISLYVIACEPTLSRYRHAVDFYRALTQITSGRMVPLLNAAQLGDYIIGSALETLETENLIAQFENTILEDVYGQGKSVEEVIERVQQELETRKVQMNTLQVDEVYLASKEAEENVGMWRSAGKLGEARGRVQQIHTPRMKSEYMGASAGLTGGSVRSFASTPCGAMPRKRSAPSTAAYAPPPGAAPRTMPGYMRGAASLGRGGFGGLGKKRRMARSAVGSTASMAEGEAGGADEAEEDDSGSSDEALGLDLGSGSDMAPRGKIDVTGKGKEKEAKASPSLSAAAYGTRARSAYPPGGYGPTGGVPQVGTAAPAPAMNGMAYAPPPPPPQMKIPQVQVVQQAVSLEQTRRLVMQGLTRNSKVGPGGILTAKGAWANKASASVAIPAPVSEVPASEKMEVDGAAK